MGDENQVPVHRPSVLFICTHNAGRSQIAAGYMKTLSKGKVEVLSAGTAPKDCINPLVITAMAEEGIDISQNVPTLLNQDSVDASDVVVTIGCGDVSSMNPDKRYEDWVLMDAAGQSIETVRTIRDDIKIRVEKLLSELEADARNE